MKFWMIVNTVSCEEMDDSRIIERDVPTFIHEDREKAEGELLRLQAKYTDGEFYLLEAVAEAVPLNGDPKILAVREVPE